MPYPVTPKYAEGVVYEGQAITILAHAVNDDGNDLVQADVSTITYKIVDDETGDELNAGVLNPVDIIHDELVLDQRWGQDQDGYNVEWLIHADQFTLLGCARYWCQMLLQTVNGIIPITGRFSQRPLA